MRRFTINLQRFAEDDGSAFLGLFDVDDPVDEFGEPLNPTPPAGTEGNGTETPPEGGTSAQGEGQTPPAGSQPTPPTEGTGTENPPAEGDKKPQTPEENAFFAQQRREQERQRLIEQERQKWATESPEAKIARTLADAYGVPVDQLAQVIEAQNIARQAQAVGMTPEAYAQVHAAQQLAVQNQQRVYELEYQQYENRIANETAQLKQRFGFLSDEDIQAAQVYMLKDLQDVNMPLEKAVFAVHGPKIAEQLSNLAKQEALAEVGGRKSPLPPSGARTADDPTAALSPEELRMAKVFKMSPEEYVKWSR